MKKFTICALRILAFSIGILVCVWGFVIEMRATFQTTWQTSVIEAFCGVILLALGEMSVVLAINEKRAMFKIISKLLLLYVGISLFIGSLVQLSRTHVATGMCAIYACIGLTLFFSGVYIVGEKYHKIA